jgi:hypothetical protein
MGKAVNVYLFSNAKIFYSKKSFTFAKKFIMNKLFFNILLIFSILAGCGLFYGCWTCKTTYEYIPQEIKDYSLFKEGSYWIYEDSVTNSIDSVVLEQSLIEYLDASEESCELFESYTGKYCHHLSDTLIFLNLDLQPNFTSTFHVVAFDSINFSQYGTLKIPWWNFQYSVIEYWIGETVFNDVQIKENSIFKAYWVKHIGLIRYEIYNDNNEILNTYNLIRYNINQ